jgi:PEGA domain-containing protein
MVKHLIGAIALAGATALPTGCATIVHGTTQRVQIDSTPHGADVAIDDAEHVTTPAAVDLSRGHSHTLVFRKAGYQDAIENLTSGMSGWMVGNLVAGGVIGIAIDASDGAGRKLSADSVNVTLTPRAPPAEAAAGSPHHTQAELPPAAQSAAIMRGLQTVAQPAGSEQPVVVPAAPEESPPVDFNDDESGFSHPAPQMPSSQ